MKINLLHLLDTYMISLSDIANSLDMDIIGDKVVPRGEIPLEHFIKVVGDFVAEGIEAGETPSYIFASLMRERDDKEVLLEMLRED